MADKVVITSAKQLDQKTYEDLKQKSKNQLKREVAEREMVIAEIEAEEARKEIADLVAKVNEKQAAFLESIAFLHEHKLLPTETIAAYTTAGGSFAPHLRHRPVDADRMLAIKAQIKADAEGKTVKKRRARAPKA